MRRLLPILALVCSAWSLAWDQSQNGAAPATPATAPSAAANTASIPLDENARKAKALVDQAIQALGGPAYLNDRDRETQGHIFGFHHGRSTGGGTLFWAFWQFPDKERVELTKERDIAELYVGNKAWEITYKGPKALEQEKIDDYVRRRRFSLETVLRTWVNDPGVAFLFEGNAIAAQHSSLQVKLINAKNESVTINFDVDSHLPIRKSFEWRDPVDKQKNLEEEVYENYRQVSGVTVPYNVTRFFNGDMAGERFITNVIINPALDQAMFDPNSGYNPNKLPEKRKSK